jgi:hypothetical protein
MRLAILPWLSLVVLGCAHPPAPAVAPTAEAATLDRLYLEQRYGELALLAAGVMADEAATRERIAEARFFRALAWLAEDPQGNQDRALLELRRLEFEFSDVIWGRLAALHVASATRVQALRATLLELAAEQSAMQVRVEALEQSLADLQGELTERELEIAEFQRARNELLEQLDQERSEMAATSARLRELENELEALKQIDMQRDP